MIVSFLGSLLETSRITLLSRKWVGFSGEDEK
jgi:hypothetical protein